MVLILIYLLLTAVAAFLAYQTISEVLEQLNNPVMSVTYQEVDSFPRPGQAQRGHSGCSGTGAAHYSPFFKIFLPLAYAGIALYPGNAQLLSCSHYYHNDIPPLVDPGKPQDIDCVVTEVTYVGPFSTKGEVSLFQKREREKTTSKTPIVVHTVSFLTETRSGDPRPV